MLTRTFALLLCLAGASFGQALSNSAKRHPTVAVSGTANYEYRMLATNKTSTMERELNEAGEAGFQFEGVMGGTTGFGGSETVVVLSRDPADEGARYEYKLLATNKTSTMQKELREAANVGYEYCGQTVYKSAFGGSEVVVIVTRARGSNIPRHDYKLLSTSKTSTMQKEMVEAATEGYRFVGMSVGQTAFGGEETVVIMRKPKLK